MVSFGQNRGPWGPSLVRPIRGRSQCSDGQWHEDYVIETWRTQIDGRRWPPMPKNQRKEGWKIGDIFSNKIWRTWSPTIMHTGKKRKGEKGGRGAELTSSSGDLSSKKLMQARWRASKGKLWRSSSFCPRFFNGRKGEEVSPLNKAGGEEFDFSPMMFSDSN